MVFKKIIRPKKKNKVLVKLAKKIKKRKSVKAVKKPSKVVKVKSKNSLERRKIKIKKGISTPKSVLAVSKNIVIANLDLFTDEHTDVIKHQTRETEIDFFDETPKNESNLSMAEIDVSQKLSIRSGQQGVSSPYIVDLSVQSLYSKRVIDGPAKRNFEETLAFMEERIGRVKTNFITPEVRRHSADYVRITNHRPGPWRRTRLRAFGAITNTFEKLFRNFSHWGENQTEKILEKTAAHEILDNNKYITNHNSESESSTLFSSRELAVSMRLFVIMILFLAIPFKAYTFYQELKNQKFLVMGASTSVYDDFNQGLKDFENLEFSSANESFVSAKSNISVVNHIISTYPPFLLSLAKIVPSVGDQVSSGLALMQSGNDLAEIGLYMSNLFTSLQTGEADNITTLRYLRDGLQQTLGLLTATTKNLSKVDLESLPNEYQDKFSTLLELLPASAQVFSEAANFSNFAIDFLGGSTPQRYLVVFQNSNELRPTGGFVGTIAEVDIRDAKLQKFYLPPGGVYDLQGNLEVLLASPQPLSILNANWQMQDANWFFDFPTSAKKLMWFYEKSGGPTVDGVIAINSSILPKLLAITGPIELSEFNLTITAENVITELQREIEFDYDKQLNQPKKIISSLMPILLNKIETLPSQDFFNLFSVLHKSLHVKDLQLYHSQTKLETAIINFGFGGEVKYTNQDYLAIVDTNIGGGKTDNVISQQVLMETKISPTGDIINTLRIIKKHNGSLTDDFSGNTYRDYLRVYVPLGSKLISAQGFNPPAVDEFNNPRAGYSDDTFLAEIEKNPIKDENSGTRITEEFGKTVFANWMKLEPGQQQEVVLTYSLPMSVVFKTLEEKNIFVKVIDSLISKLGLFPQESQSIALHTLFIQKQSGQQPYDFSQEIFYPAGWQALISSVLKDKTAQQGSRIFYQNQISSDQLWGLIFSR